MFMESEAAADLLEKAAEVLKANDRGEWTVPQPNLYPHQWLWDSCFISIGLRHLDVKRAQTELRSLLRGQWSNGMMAHLIFSTKGQRLTQRLEEGWVNPQAPNGTITSGLTQPPVFAEAVWLIGQKIKMPERRTWFKEMLPHLIDYHQWFYNERDVGDGLVFIIHPYESGLDNTPSSISEIHKHGWPWWLSVIDAIGLDRLGNLFRKDIKYVSSKQRMNNSEAIAYFYLAWRLHRQAFDVRKVMKHPHFAVEDLAFNCIFIRSNERLKQIAKSAGHELPAGLLENMKRTEAGLENLWDEQSGMYFSRSLITGELIHKTTIASLLPLYSGAISKNRAQTIVGLLKRRSMFSTPWPVPSVPQTSSYFDPIKYWQGPTWVNTNWFLVNGLRRYAFEAEAKVLQTRTLKMVGKSGCVDYFNPLDGSAVGAPDFSWTAALTIDLLKS
jgi:hypothetical protein